MKHNIKRGIVIETSDVCEIFATLFSPNAHYVRKPVDMGNENVLSVVLEKHKNKTMMYLLLIVDLLLHLMLEKCWIGLKNKNKHRGYD